MKLIVASLFALSLAVSAAPAIAQTANAAASATTCPPNGNTQSAGIVGKGNGTTNAVAQAGTTTTTCPPAATTAAPAASTAGTMTGGTSNGTTTAKTQ
jgi:hypothetical protein